MCRAISGGSREWQPAAGAEAASRVSETPEPDTSPTHPTYSPTRPALPSARNRRVPSLHLPRKLPVLAGGMQGRGSALGNCKRQFHRADYLYSLPMFMSCSVRQCTRSCCVGAIQDYLLGHVCRAAPGGWLLSAFYISLWIVNSLPCRGRRAGGWRGGGSVWTDFLSPIKSGLLLEEEDLIFPKMQSAAFSTSQFWE